jgi:hypothetical protein
MATTSTLTPIQTELLTRADTILNSISGAVGKATTLASEQIPEIAIQYVMYGRAFKSFVIIFAIGLLLVGMYFTIFLAIKNVNKWPLSYDGGWTERHIYTFAAGAFFTIIGVVTVVENISSFLMVWFAPKIWLIIEMAKITKGLV